MLQYFLWIHILIGITLFPLIVYVAWNAHRSLSGSNRSVQGKKKNSKATLAPLVTRATFEERLIKLKERYFDDSHEVSVYFLSINGLKHINQQYGYASGDELLQRIGLRLRSLPFNCVSHLGGDEFAAFIEGDKDNASVLKLAEADWRILKQPFNLSHGNIIVTCSIGVCTRALRRVDTTQVNEAYRAMCRGKTKESGVNTIHFGHEDESNEDSYVLARELKMAIANHQLQLVFQPKFRMTDGKITGAEALLRWKHPVLGAVSPAVFIPIAEQHGLIDCLGEWVIQEACLQARILQDKGLQMRVAINLSGQQLRHPDLIYQIQTALRRYQIHPSLVTCEITESLAVDEASYSRKALLALETLGVHLSMDDFGTGFSNLNYLQDLPMHEVKIDRRFVQQLGECDISYAIVDAIIKMSHALGKRVVAEGVENKNQMETLSKLGCDEVQGFYLSRPVPPEMLALWASDSSEISPSFSASQYGDAQIREVQDR